MVTAEIDLTTPRGELLSRADGAHFDLLIIGGGIHGAASARSAATQGLRTLLLEKADYGAATSTRSSKMAHGGLRYLEMFDFEQVFEGIKAREDLFASAPHIVSPTRFLIPIPKGQLFFKLKLGLGLYLYDLMVREKGRKHCFLTSDQLQETGFYERRHDLIGCYSYTDGLLNDGLLTLENVLAARQHGAICLNYAGVTALDERPTGVEVAWKDELSGTTHRATAAAVLNCAGPWAPFLVPAGTRPEVRLSRGTHLIFNRPWKGPSLFLPMEGKARYYFVWPHAAGTMVGTTERETDSLDLDPFPSVDEIDEILARLKKDLPESGLDRTSLHYCFAGVRTLPLRPNSKAGTTRLSRKHIWHGGGRVLSLVGGKLTTATWTAEEGVQKVLGQIAPGKTFRSVRRETMPRANVPAATIEKFSLDARRSGLSEEQIQRLIHRYGGDVGRFDVEQLASLGADTRVGEVALALNLEQAETVEDVMRRRLNLEYLTGHGLEALPQIVKLMTRLRPGRSFDGEAARYQERLTQLRALMGLSPLSEAPRMAATS